jgi:hypothetical protein
MLLDDARLFRVDDQALGQGRPPAAQVPTPVSSAAGASA